MAGLMSAEGLDLFSDDEEGIPSVPPPRRVVAPTKVESRVKAGHDSDDEGRGIGSLIEPTSLAAGYSRPDDDLPPGGAKKLEAGVGPVMWCGRKFHKSLHLLPDKWVTFGRRQGCTVVMNSSFVSLSHCKVRWSSAERCVQLRDTSRYGTFVNEKKVHRNQDKVAILAHGDKVVVRDQASNVHYDYLLDLRPVSLAFTDPRDLEEMGARQRPASTEVERLKAKLLQLQEQQRKQEEEILEDEKKYYDLEAKHFELTEKANIWKEETERLDQETKLLQDELQERRARWKAKLADLYKSNKVKLRPLIEKTADKQEQVARMEMKSTELERAIYPERFALAELPDEVKPATKGVGDITEDETEHEGERPRARPAPATNEDSAPAKSAGYAPTTPAKTPAPDSALMESAQMPDSAAFHEEAVPFVMNLSLNDLFGEDDDDAPLLPAADTATATASEPDAKRQRTDAGASSTGGS